MPKTPVGIDLFVCRCIEGGQLTTDGTPVTYPPQLARRQPPNALGVGACSGFGRCRSERVFRNEFPYLGRVGPAAWAGLRPAGGLGTVGNVDRDDRAGPAARTGARRPRRRRAESGSEGCSQGSRRRPGRASPSGRRSRRRRPAAGTAGSADLRALDQVLPQGPGSRRQAGLLHRQGRPHRVRPARHRRRHHRAGRRAEEDPARHAAARHAARARNPRSSSTAIRRCRAPMSSASRTVACPTTKRPPN